MIFEITSHFISTVSWWIWWVWCSSVTAELNWTESHCTDVRPLQCSALYCIDIDIDAYHCQLLAVIPRGQMCSLANCPHPSSSPFITIQYNTRQDIIPDCWKCGETNLWEDDISTSYIDGLECTRTYIASLRFLSISTFYWKKVSTIPFDLFHCTSALFMSIRAVNL